MIRKVAFLKVYEQYAKAMTRRRPDCVLEIDRFHYYAKNFAETVSFDGDNFIIGQWQYGCFCPSHFAPATNRGGVKLIRDLKDKLPVIFQVTPDLSPMLRKLGYKYVGKMTACFRDEEVVKDIWVSSYLRVMPRVTRYFMRQFLSELPHKMKRLCNPFKWRKRKRIFQSK